LLWRGDFQNARRLLQAFSWRIDKPKKSTRKKAAPDAQPLPGAAFHAHRQAQAQRTRVQSQVLIALNGDYSSNLRRAAEARSFSQNPYHPLRKHAGLALGCWLYFMEMVNC
jgi:hypothetical protein